MPRKRGRLDIITDMLATLQSSGGEIKPTPMMYKSHLSHVQISSHRKVLHDKELIQKVKKKSNEYIIMTDKGFEFFEKLKQMREFEKTFGL